MPDRSRVMTQTKRGYPGPPACGFGVGLTTPHSKKLIVTKVEQRKSGIDLTMMDRVGDRWEEMEGYCSTGQSPQWAVVPVEEEEEEEEDDDHFWPKHVTLFFLRKNIIC
jgi:hypothetical protein